MATGLRRFMPGPGKNNSGFDDWVLILAETARGNFFDPAVNRVFVRFTDNGGLVRGATSVAVRTQ